MRLSAPWGFFIVCLFSVFAAPQVAAQPPVAVPLPPPGTLVGRAAWDNSFLYFSFVVDDSDILGTNARPMSSPELDDSIGVYFQTSAARPDAPDAATHAMLVSSAGGFTFLDGDAQTNKLVPHAAFLERFARFTVKFGVTLQGTLNRSDDRDKSYTVTLAVPLSELGLDPKTLAPGTVLGFNIVARSRKAAALTALSPSVKTEADTVIPSKWTRLVLTAPDGSGGGDTVGALVAPRIAPDAKPPLIDGVFRDADWPAAPQSRVAFASPDKPTALTVIAPAGPVAAAIDDTIPPVLRYAAPIKLPQLLMARYLPTFQADARKIATPRRNIFGADNSLLLSEQPATGIGPWFSDDRTGYHQGELSAMRRAGIDVALVQIGGPEVDTAVLDEKALLVMVGALRELATTQTPSPKVALYLDTDALVAPGTPKINVETEEGRERLWLAVRRWMTLVPPEFRARVILPSSAEATGKTVPAYPIFLSNAEGIIGANSDGWEEFLIRRFAQEFGAASGGATLVLVGGTGFDVQKTPLAAAMSPLRSGAGTGSIATYRIQPGQGGLGLPLVPRNDAAVYKAAWEAALAANPTWFVLDSWNDWMRGTEIAASRQYGPRYEDMTRLYSIQMGGLPARSVRWVDNDAPRQMRPGDVVTTSVTVQNIGMDVLSGDKGVSLVYRWRRGGVVVAEGPLRLPLTDPLLPSQKTTLPIGLIAAAQNSQGRLEPLAPGDYLAEIDFTQTKSGAEAKASDEISTLEFFGDSGITTLQIPVTITATLPDSVQFASTTTPSLLLSGATYPVNVRLRWMGAAPLSPDAASLVYQIVSEDGKTAIQNGTIPLPRELLPGAWETISATVAAQGAGSSPLPVAAPELRKSGTDTTTGGNYRIRWILTRTQATDAIAGEYVDHVAVYPEGDEARIISPPPPASPYDAGSLNTLEVTVVNRGSTTWAKGSFAVSCHWYFPDGLESDWRLGLPTPIDREVRPGASIKVKVNVRAPDRAGEYILAFDVLRSPDTFLSTRFVTRTNDLGLVPVRVNGGRSAFVDLTRLFDTAATATESAPEKGDVDGTGASFPAEWFPPDVYGIVAYLSPSLNDTSRRARQNGGVYPSGYYTINGASARQISFRYGTDISGNKNAVACKGQVIQVPRGNQLGIHLAATATGGADRPLTLTLRYGNGTTETITRTVADWNRAPGASDPIAVSTPRKRTKTGDVATASYVRHLIIAADISRELVSITLPTDEKIKIFAVTLER